MKDIDRPPPDPELYLCSHCHCWSRYSLASALSPRGESYCSWRCHDLATVQAEASGGIDDGYGVEAE